MTLRKTSVYALFNIETGSFLCARKADLDWLICFTEKTDADEFRDALGVRDHCDIMGGTMDAFPFDNLYLDEQFINVNSADISSEMLGS